MIKKHQQNIFHMIAKAHLVEENAIQIKINGIVSVKKQ